VDSRYLGHVIAPQYLNAEKVLWLDPYTDAATQTKKVIDAGFSLLPHP
jgi:hypothetical protein